MALPSGIDWHYGSYRVRKTVAGRRIIRSFPTLEEAKSFRALVEAGLHDAKTVQVAAASGSATVMEVVRLWWLGPLIDGEHKGGHRLHVSPVTARGYQYYIDSYISRIGDESAQSYARNTGLLKLYYDTLPNRCAWHVHSVLRMAFREAVTRGLMDRNPCEFEKPARRKRRKRTIPSRDEVDKLLIAAEEQDRRWSLFVYLSSTLGTRCGETVAVRAEDFDELDHVVRIERAATKTAGRPTIKTPKNGEPRELPIEDPASGTTFGRSSLPRATCSLDSSAMHLSGPRARSRGTQTTLRSVSRSWREPSGLPDLTLHSLRHFVATQLLIEGQPVNQVAEFLGHSPQMTLMLYGRHLDRDAMRKVGRAATSLVKRPAPAAHRPADPKPAGKPKARAATRPRRDEARHALPARLARDVVLVAKA